VEPLRALWVAGWSEARAWLERERFDVVLHASDLPSELERTIREAGASRLPIPLEDDLDALERAVVATVRSDLAASHLRRPSSRASRRPTVSVEVAAEQAEQVARFLAQAREHVVSLLAQLEGGEVSGPIAIARDLARGAERLGLEIVAILAAEMEEHLVEGRTADARSVADRLARYLSSVRGAVCS
jgi:hypothetical protein